jgi:hypothetical protein
LQRIDLGFARRQDSGAVLVLREENKMMPWTKALVVSLASLCIAACGDSKKDDLAAYEACVANAKKAGSRFEKAEFSPFEKAKINSLQDGTVAVIVPIKLDGKDAILDCNAQKQQNNTFKVNYTN